MFLKINGKSFLECNEEDLKILIDNPDYRENEFIDYKKTFSFLEIDKNKKSICNDKKIEFKVDVCSFANADGGYLIFGVSDTNGCAPELIGIDIPNDNTDKFELDRRNDLTGIEPKIPYLKFNFVKLENGKYIIIIYIKHDNFGPYVYVEDERNYRIYKRVGNGKKTVSYSELKNMFNQSQSLEKEIYNYRTERINYYRTQSEKSDDKYSKFVLFHIIPETFTDSSYNKNVFVLEKKNKIMFSSIFSELNCREYSVPCADGLRFITNTRVNLKDEGYVNNNGVIECFIDINRIIFPNGGFDRMEIWEIINRTYNNYAEICKNIWNNEKIFLCISIVGCKGMCSNFCKVENYTQYIGSIDRDKVICSPVIIEDISDKNESEILIKKLHIEYLLSIGVKYDKQLEELINEVYNT